MKVFAHINYFTKGKNGKLLHTEFVNGGIQMYFQIIVSLVNNNGNIEKPLSKSEAIKIERGKITHHHFANYTWKYNCEEDDLVISNRIIDI